MVYIQLSTVSLQGCAELLASSVALSCSKIGTALCGPGDASFLISDAWLSLSAASLSKFPHTVVLDFFVNFYSLLTNFQSLKSCLH